MTSGNYCHFLREEDRSTEQQKSCHAVSAPFVPSAVHQSSCCLNRANFVRCPYYVEAMGSQKNQVTASQQNQASPSWVQQQLSRLSRFGRPERKKRKRIYINS